MTKKGWSLLIGLVVLVAVSITLAILVRGCGSNDDNKLEKIAKSLDDAKAAAEAKIEREQAKAEAQKTRAEKAERALAMAKSLPAERPASEPRVVTPKSPAATPAASTTVILMPDAPAATKLVPTPPATTVGAKEDRAKEMVNLKGRLQDYVKQRNTRITAHENHEAEDTEIDRLVAEIKKVATEVATTIATASPKPATMSAENRAFLHDIDLKISREKDNLAICRRAEKDALLKGSPLSPYVAHQARSDAKDIEREIARLESLKANAE